MIYRYYIAVGNPYDEDEEVERFYLENVKDKATGVKAMRQFIKWYKVMDDKYVDGLHDVHLDGTWLVDKCNEIYFELKSTRKEKVYRYEEALNG